MCVCACCAFSNLCHSSFCSILSDTHTTCIFNPVVSYNFFFYSNQTRGFILQKNLFKMRRRKKAFQLKSMFTWNQQAALFFSLFIHSTWTWLLIIRLWWNWTCSACVRIFLSMDAQFNGRDHVQWKLTVKFMKRLQKTLTYDINAHWKGSNCDQCHSLMPLQLYQFKLIFVFFFVFKCHGFRLISKWATKSWWILNTFCHWEKRNFRKRRLILRMIFKSFEMWNNNQRFSRNSQPFFTESLK